MAESGCRFDFYLRAEQPLCWGLGLAGLLVGAVGLGFFAWALLLVFGVLSSGEGGDLGQQLTVLQAVGGFVGSGMGGWLIGKAYANIRPLRRVKQICRDIARLSRDDPSPEAQAQIAKLDQLGWSICQGV